MLKTNKSLTKRIKVTKNGKLKVRKAGRNKYNSRETTSERMAKKKMQDFKLPAKVKATMMPKVK